MLYQYIRVFDGDNGTLSDISLNNQDKNTLLPFDLVTSEDYIYIGTVFPVNNFYMQVDTVNDVACTMNIEYWDSTGWIDAVDVLDGTLVGGVSLAKSGIVQFSPDDDKVWNRTNDTQKGNFPTELSTIRVFDLFWMRISFTDTLNALTKVKRIVYAFTEHQQIENHDITLASYISEFIDAGQSTKTTWDDEIVTASELVLLDLKNRGLIINRGEILRFDDLYMATNYKTLELIYMNLRGDYREKLDDIRGLYMSAFPKRFTFDKNHNAFADRNEYTNKIVKMDR